MEPTEAWSDEKAGKITSMGSYGSRRSRGGTLAVGRKDMLEDEQEQRFRSRSRKQYPSTSLGREPTRNKPLSKKDCSRYGSEEKVWDTINPHSDTSSERPSESLNPSDTSNSSVYQQVCSKYIQYIKPCNLVGQFCNEEGTQELLTETDKRHFFCFVMLIKSLQMLMIAGFLSYLETSPTLHIFLKSYHEYWTFLPFGLCVLIVTMARVCPMFRRSGPFYHLMAFLVATMCYSYIMASISAFYDSRIIRKVFWLLPTTSLFIAVFTVSMNLSVVKKMIYISGLSSVIFFATAMALLPIVYEGSSGFELSIDIWLPAVIGAEILIFLLIFELQSILMGERGQIRKNDFWYVSLYL